MVTKRDVTDLASVLLEDGGDDHDEKSKPLYFDGIYIKNVLPFKTRL